MGARWRRPFCASVRRDPESETTLASKRSLSPRTQAKITGLFAGGGTSIQPNNAAGLRCRTNPNSPKLATPQPPVNTAKEAIPARLLKSFSEPSSPKSPSRFALLKASFRLYRSRCGVCAQNVKAGDGSAAVFTAECSHVFHLACITSRVCPVCSATWRSSPLLSSVGQPAAAVAEHHKLHHVRTKETNSPAAVKIYDDDEPLLSPTGSLSSGVGSAVRFNPIPEEDEGGDDHHQHHLSGVEVCVVPEVAMVSAGRSHRNYVVAVKVRAPKEFHDGRAPVDLVTVLDVRGSAMEGKLHMLKRAMRQLIGSLGPGDRLSIVAYSSTAAKRLFPLHRMSRQGQRMAAQVVDRLILATAQGASSGAGEALRKAAKVLEDRRERNPVATVMLLSDAQQQSKGADRDGRYGHVEVPIGDEAQKPAAEDPFMQCVLGGLLSVVMREVNLQLVFPGGDISSVYSCGGGSAAAVGGGGTVRLGDLRAGEERMLLVELRVSAAAANHIHRLFYRCSYRGAATQAVIRCPEQPLSLPAFHGRSDSSGQRLRNLFVATRAVAESRRLAELSDLGTAVHLLSSARTLLLQSPSCDKKLLLSVEAELTDLQQRRQQSPTALLSRAQPVTSDDGREALTPTSAWRAAERLAKLAMMRKSLNRVSDLHGFENARF